MTYGPILKQLLGPYFSGRVFPDTAPDVPGQDPYVIYQRVGGIPTYFTEGALADKANARVQLEVWSTSKQATYAAMVHIMRSVAAATDMEPLGQPIDDYEPALRIYGSRVDISMYYNLT